MKAEWIPALVSLIATGLYAFALWAKKPDYASAKKWGAVSGMILFVCLLIQANKPERTPIGITALAFLILSVAELTYLKWLQGTYVKSVEFFLLSLRSLTLCVLGIALYFFVSKVLFQMGLTWIAVPVAIVATFVSVPVFVRIAHKAREIPKGPELEMIQSAFELAKSPIRKFYFLEMDKINFHNAMVCGPKYGFGPFQRSVFISKSLFRELSFEEVRAVIYHEAAHFKLNHVSRRFWLGILSVFANLIGLFVIAIVLDFALSVPLQPMIIVLSMFVLQLPLTLVLSRNQEYEADLEAVKMGADPESLISALRKIYTLNGRPLDYKPGPILRIFQQQIHPDLDDRSLTIREGRIPKHHAAFSWKSFARAFVFLLAFASLHGIWVKQNAVQKFAPKRTVASHAQAEP